MLPIFTKTDFEKFIENKQEIKPNFQYLKPDVLCRITKILIQSKNHTRVVYLFLKCATSNKIQLCLLLKNVKLFKLIRCFCLNKNFCKNKCWPIKLMIAPGIKNFHEDTIQVYKTYANVRVKNTINSSIPEETLLHFQYGIYEGCYVKVANDVFVQNQVCETTIDNLIIEDQPTTSIEPTVMALDIEVTSSTPYFCKASNIGDEIISIAFSFLNEDQTTQNFCFVTVKDTANFVNLSDNYCQLFCFSNEKELLSAIPLFISTINPDIVVGYNSTLFDLLYIQDRRKLLKMSPMSFKRYNLPAIVFQVNVQEKNRLKYGFVDMGYFCYCDVMYYVKQHRLSSNKLDDAAKHFLNDNKVHVSFEQINSDHAIGEITKLVEYNVHDAHLTLRLFLHLDGYNICYMECNTFYLNSTHVESGSVAKLKNVIFFLGFNNKNDRDESDPYLFDFSETYMELNTLNRRRFEPNLINNANCKAVKLKYIFKNQTFTGGYVIQPTPGIYENVAVLDFEAMYANIMIFNNFCLSNLVFDNENNLYVITNKEGIISKHLKIILASRQAIREKQKLCSKSSFEWKLLNMAQLSRKLIGNSIYGFYGLFFPSLAERITNTGRVLLQTACETINSYLNPIITFRTIYGDTDSCFVQISGVAINDAEMNSGVKQLIQHVNTTLQNSGTLAFEKKFNVVLLKAKKKYVGIVYDTEQKVVLYHDTVWSNVRATPPYLKEAISTFIQNFLMKKSFEDCCQTLRILFQSFFDANKQFNLKYLHKFCSSITYTGCDTIAKTCRTQLEKRQTKILPEINDRVSFYYILNTKSSLVKDNVIERSLFDPNIHELNMKQYIKPIKSFFEFLLHAKLISNIQILTEFDKICESLNIKNCETQLNCGNKKRNLSFVHHSKNQVNAIRASTYKNSNVKMMHDWLNAKLVDKRSSVVKQTSKTPTKKDVVSVKDYFNSRK